MREILQALSRGEDVKRRAEKLEPGLKRFCRRRERVYGYRTGDYLCREDCLYEVSPAVKNYWDAAYPRLSPQERHEALLRFVNVREREIGRPQADSVEILKNRGWTAEDIMAAYIYSRLKTGKLLLSPDIARQAAREDPGAALRLLEGRDYDRIFPYYHKGVNIFRQFEWIDFTYLFMGESDLSFLKKSHKSKRLAKHCARVLEKLSSRPVCEETPQNPRDCPDFSVFQNITLGQSRLMHSAAGQKLLNGNSQNGYYVMSFHLIDERRGLGAALCFDRLNKSPDYADTCARRRGVYFYRFRHLYLSDYIPESRRLPREKMPEDFVKKAYRAFALAAGLEIGRGQTAEG